jgi:hypothetical protein
MDVGWSGLFSDANRRWNCLALHLVWAVTVTYYYGGLLNIKNVGPHLHFNTVMAGTVSSNIRLTLIRSRGPQIAALFLKKRRASLI